MPSTPPTIDALTDRAARKSCAKHYPQLAFAAQFLPREQRSAVFALAAVHRQLVEILEHQEAGNEPATNPTPATVSAAGCCGGSDSLEQRRSVCSSVLEHLYTGQATGKPELDGFHAVVTRLGIEREAFESLADAHVSLLKLRRVATWKRLRQLGEQAAGAVVTAALRVLHDGRMPAITDTQREQLVAGVAAVQLVTILSSLTRDHRPSSAQPHNGHRDDRLLLPLDDLVKCSLTEADVRRILQTPDDANDPRWQQFVTLQCERARNLLRGTGHAVRAIRDARSRRAVTTLIELYTRRVDQLERDRLLRVRPMNLWDGLRVLPQAMRRASAAQP